MRERFNRVFRDLILFGIWWFFFWPRYNPKISCDSCLGIWYTHLIVAYVGPAAQHAVNRHFCSTMYSIEVSRLYPCGHGWPTLPFVSDHFIDMYLVFILYRILSHCTQHYLSWNEPVAVKSLCAPVFISLQRITTNTAIASIANDNNAPVCFYFSFLSCVCGLLCRHCHEFSTHSHLRIAASSLPHIRLHHLATAILPTEHVYAPARKRKPLQALTQSID